MFDFNYNFNVNVEWVSISSNRIVDIMIIYTGTQLEPFLRRIKLLNRFNIHGDNKL